MIRTITTPGPGLAFLLCLQLLPFLPRIQANEATPCYAPDTKRIDDRFMPCISMDGMDSMCCRLNDHDPDICKPNGLCYWENVDGGGRNGLYRGLCTSQGWDTSNCLPKTICADDNAGGNSSYTSQLSDCDNGNYCCGNTTACCTDEKMFTLSPTLVPIGSSSSSSATATVTATVSGKADSSTKTAIGLGVGIPLAVLAIAGAGGGFLWGRRSMKAKYAQIQNQGINMPMGVLGGVGGAQQVDSKSVHEADVVQPQPLELPAGKNDR
ncbi:uncharacterized protein APUU_80908S [Aspergillus puulaauensis]|uniref:Mid2 domain-containing protein n=1 Tax=Aspergillus puulaauensis TaxID=1220207 RepID=A0A7R7XZJ8_9EURO|nr:uncharacterized protein APUU_80908S [Aspergillus puulaauensis]BCS30605.1 hypothetical protein APUU_80908S [Aspergillus puulaauensis]